MVFIVNAENRHWFERDLLEMHQQRRRVFVEGLGWPLPLDGAMELDQYDGEDVIYLLVKDDPDARLRASVRLLRTDRPHPLLDLFQGLCDDGVPQGTDVWEISRFCTNPGVTQPPRPAGAVCGKSSAARWRRRCCSTSSGSRSSPTGHCGRWRCIAAGRRCGWAATQPDRHDEVTAIAAEVTRGGLRRVRERFGIPGPVIRFFPAAMAAPGRVAA